MSLVARLMSKYQWLSDNHGESGWWDAHADEVRQELEAGYAGSLMSAASA
jgi:hypothetical protein